MPVLSGASDASYLLPACAVQSGIARGSRRAQDAPDPWKMANSGSGQMSAKVQWPAPSNRPRLHGYREPSRRAGGAWGRGSHAGQQQGQPSIGAITPPTSRRRPAPMRRKPQNEASPRRDSQAHLGAVTARATVHTFKSNNHGAQPRRQHGARPRHPADHDDPF